MRFFRRDRRFGWLALFALTAQLVLTFGHVHLSAFHHQTDVAATIACAANVQPPCPKHSDDADCPICNLITLAGTLVAPQPIAIEFPSLVANVVAPKRSIESVGHIETVHFQARAPPLG